MKIVKSENSVLSYTPYHPEFVAGAKNLAGKWDRAKQAWVFPASQEARVRDLCKAVYGTDGSAPTCTLRAMVEGSNQGTELYIAGRQVARVFGRDSGAKLGDNVVVVSGGFSSGGSRNHPRLTNHDGTVIELLECPIPAARAYVAEHPGEAQILGEEPAADGNVILFNKH